MNKKGLYVTMNYILIVCVLCLVSLSPASFADKIITSIQKDLNLLGYESGPIDGLVGKRTVTSLKSFYRDYGGEYNGNISSNDLDALRFYAERYSNNRNTRNGLVKDGPKKPWSHRFSSKVKRAGKLSQRMEIRNGDCSQDYFTKNKKFGCNNDRERSEIVFHEWEKGKNKWIGLSVKIDPETTPDPFSDWNAAGLCTSLMQLKVFDRGVNQQKFVSSQSFVGGAPIFFIRLCGEKILVHVIKTDGNSRNNGQASQLTYLLGYTNQFKKNWMDIAINFNDLEYKNKKSSLKIYLNGKEKVNIKDFRKFTPDVYSFKYGFYRSHIKERLKEFGNGKKSSTLIAYFDEVQFGSSMEDIKPSNENPVD